MVGWLPDVTSTCLTHSGWWRMTRTRKGPGLMINIFGNFAVHSKTLSNLEVFPANWKYLAQKKWITAMKINPGILFKDVIMITSIPLYWFHNVWIQGCRKRFILHARIYWLFKCICYFNILSYFFLNIQRVSVILRSKFRP